MHLQNFFTLTKSKGLIKRAYREDINKMVILLEKLS